MTLHDHVNEKTCDSHVLGSLSYTTIMSSLVATGLLEMEI